MRKSRPRPPRPRCPRQPALPRRRSPKLSDGLPQAVRGGQRGARSPNRHRRRNPRPRAPPLSLRLPTWPQPGNPPRQIPKELRRPLTRPTTRSGSLAMPLIGFRRRRSPPVFGPMIAGLGGFNKAANEFGDNGRRFGNVWPRCAAEVRICDHAAGSRSVKKANAPVRRELPRRLSKERPGRPPHRE